jgi:uncharacterized protein (DUF433 family)
MHFYNAVYLNTKNMGGQLCFVGTLIPVEKLLRHLACGGSVDAFLEAFYSISEEQVTAVLEHVAEIIELEQLNRKVM